MVRPINAHGNLLMVITVQMAVTGGAGAKPLLGSTNSVWCYGLVTLLQITGSLQSDYS